MPENKDRIPELETVCPDCKGARGEPERGRWYPCHTCRGAGYLPTEFGKIILSLVQHNFKPMLHDAADD